jgi:hypothetical protein
MKKEENPLFNKSFLAKNVAEYKTEIKDNSVIFLKWHNDNQKEEELQTNFLNDIFGKVLGYEIDTGEAEFNLLTEYKTQKDGTKVDGVLGFITRDKKDIRVAIELKAKNTTNLDSVEKQAFEYRDKIDGIEWVITSNTNEIRLYSAGSGGRLKYQSWTFFELANSFEKQKEFHFLLSKDRLFTSEKSTSPTHKLLQDNTKEEESIEKRFYNDYKELRKKLFNHLREQNPTKEPTTLLSKTQKLLDRVIFVCFCEDLNLLPDKIFTKLLKTTQEAFVEITVWQQIKGLFNAIDKGWPQKNINKFNGGLFAKDTELDELVLQDNILKEIIKISDWDFGSELTVNILGHIFEQSITDLEEIKADIAGETHDKKQGKRKKDGVFYTPEYITRYIVEEAVGGWLNDRKTELGIEKLPELTDDDLKKSKKPSKNTQRHIDFWNSYAKILQNIKVLDPACGSGAFLVAVFNFLEKEWLNLSETLRKLGDDEQAGLFSYSQVYKHILKNNIYGVDLNPESVQITKLSLWLKTANRSEELTTLDANIKCGNSLIDDPQVETGFYINNEGERVSLAFNWQNEFQSVFENGGFDVAVGNPPYVNIENLKSEIRSCFFEIYQCCKGRTDIYVVFVEKALNLTKAGGMVSFIIPYAFTNQNYAGLMRAKLINDTQIKEIVDLSNYYVFDGVGVKNIILTYENCREYQETKVVKYNSAGDFLQGIKIAFTLSQKEFLKLNLQRFTTNDFRKVLHIKDKVESKSISLDKICHIAYGVRVNSKTDSSKTKSFYIYDKQEVGYKKFTEGENIERYHATQNGFLNYQPQEHYNSMFPELFESEKLMFINVVSDKMRFCYDNEGLYNSHTVINCVRYDKLLLANHISLKNIKSFANNSVNFDYKYLLAVINSSLMNWYFLSFLSEGMHFYPNDARKLPIPQIPLTEQQPLITHAQKMLDLTREFNEKRTAFVDYFRGKFALQKITRNLGHEVPSQNQLKITKRLESWHNLEFADFIKELGKQKVSLSSTDEFDFKPLFDREKKVCVELQNQITKTDSEIDKMVYALYGLSEEEIGVVEGLVG